MIIFWALTLFTLQTGPNIRRKLLLPLSGKECEILAPFYETGLSHIPVDLNPNIYCDEKFAFS
jgi:hypothetical protein